MNNRNVNGKIHEIGIYMRGRILRTFVYVNDEGEHLISQTPGLLKIAYQANIIFDLTAERFIKNRFGPNYDMHTNDIKQSIMIEDYTFILIQMFQLEHLRSPDDIEDELFPQKNK